MASFVRPISRRQIGLQNLRGLGGQDGEFPRGGYSTYRFAPQRQGREYDAMERDVLIERPLHFLVGLRIEPGGRALRQADKVLDRAGRLLLEKADAKGSFGRLEDGVKPGRARRLRARKDREGETQG